VHGCVCKCVLYDVSVCLTELLVSDRLCVSVVVRLSVCA